MSEDQRSAIEGVLEAATTLHQSRIVFGSGEPGLTAHADSKLVWALKDAVQLFLEVSAPEPEFVDPFNHWQPTCGWAWFTERSGRKLRHECGGEPGHPGSHTCDRQATDRTHCPATYRPSRTVLGPLLLSVEAGETIYGWPHLGRRGDITKQGIMLTAGVAMKASVSIEVGNDGKAYPEGWEG